MSKTNTTIYIISILAIIFLTSNSLTAQTRSAGNTNNADIPQNEETEKTIFNTPLNRGYKLLHPTTKIGAYFGIGGLGVSFGHYIGDLVNTGNWIHGINLNISKHASYLYYSPTYYEDDSKSGFL